MSIVTRWGARFSVLVLVASSAGCAVSIDVSDHPPFADSLGTVVLRDATPLYELADDGWYGTLELGGHQPTTSTVVCELPPGTLLRVDKVRRREDPLSNTFWVLGELWINDGEAPLPFQYHWGNWDVIWRAPWELTTVPDQRWVGLDGKSYVESSPIHRNARR